MSTPARISMVEGDTIPTPPPAGQILFYAKTDGVFYTQNSGGSESVIGAGAYVGGTGIDITGNVISSDFIAGTGIDITGDTISADFIAGTGISITGNTISAIPVTYTAGQGIDITGTVISSSLTAGPGIDITGDTISGTYTAINGVSLSGTVFSGAYTAGTGIDITGSVITNTGSGATYTAGIGIDITGTVISGAYTAGTGIDITGGIISNTGSGTSYVAGTGIDITGNVISGNYTAGDGVSITGSIIAGAYTAGASIDITSGVISVVGGGGGFYTAGEGIDITGSVISSTVTSSGGEVGTVQLADGLGGFAAVPSNNATWVLTSNGPSNPPTWEPVPVSGGTVTSIDIHSDVGLNFTGGPITSSGFFTVDGSLLVENGGTGGTTAAEAMVNLLPTQTGNTGASLITDGNGGLSWYVVPGIAYVAGAGISIDSNSIASTVADNLGNVNLVQISNGDGTLSNIPTAAIGRVLTSAGPGLAPAWLDPQAAGTVTDIVIQSSDQVGLHITGGDEYIPPQDGVKHITSTGTIGLGGILSLKNGGTGTNDQGFPDLIISTALPPQAGNSGLFLTTNGTVSSWGVPAGGGTVISVDVSGGATGITFSGGPVTESGVITMGGHLGVDHGGTGAVDAPTAINNLLPAQGGSNIGKILTTDGTNVLWTTSSAGSVTSVNIHTVDGLGLTVTGGPITSSGTFNLGGVLSIDNGGTGATDAEHARNNILPGQFGNQTKFLTTDGTDVFWGIPAGGGTVTSIDVSGGTTGLTTSGGPISTNGTITFGGILNVLNGGTGSGNPNTGLNNLLPVQTGNATKILTTDGTNTSWTTASAGSVTSVNINPSTTGLTFSGGPITSSGTFLVGGILNLLNGGTGSSNAQGARNNILPDQTTHTGMYLQTDGTNCSWQAVASSSGTVTSVDISGGVTGLTFSGGPVTTSGTITMGGNLAILNGGTGANNATGALNNLLPSQTGNTGKVLSTTGSGTQWISVTAAVAGTDTQIQYNDSGAFGASANLVVNKSTGAVTCGSTFTGIGTNITGANLTIRPLKYQTGSLNRWLLQANAVSESGSNAGSNFEFTAVNDDGTTTNQVFTVVRSTQIVDFKQNPTINGVQVGYSSLPRVTTFNAAAKGCRVAVTAGFTIPANTYAAGDAFSFYNDSASGVTITQGSGLTLRFDGSATTGNRTLASRGSCFVWFNSTTEAIINGSIS